LFKEIAEQLKEIDESYKPQQKKEEVKFDNFEDTEHERKRKQVKMEPQMDFTVDNLTKSIIIDYVNVDKVRVNYYLIDLEILFSKTPFISSVIIFALISHFRTRKTSASCSPSSPRRSHLTRTSQP
jgi:hypothetical protein